VNYVRIGCAASAALVAYLAAGGLMFAALPALKREFARYPQVFRAQSGQLSHLPQGLCGMLLAMLALTVLYAKFWRGAGLLHGAAFGVLVGVFAFGAFVLHNYVNLNIGARLTAYSGLAYLIEWTVVGLVIGLIYRPA
jgi:hypothetical protein